MHHPAVPQLGKNWNSSASGEGLPSSSAPRTKARSIAKYDARTKFQEPLIVQIFPMYVTLPALAYQRERGKLCLNLATRCDLRHDVYDALALLEPASCNQTVGHPAFARPSNWPESKQDHEGLRDANAGKNRFSA